MIRYLTTILLLLMLKCTYAQKLDNFVMNCLPGFDEEHFSFIEGIRSMSWNGDQIYIEILENCSYDTNYRGSIDYRNDSLFLNYEKIKKWSGDSSFRLPYVALCDCLFELQFEIKDLPDKPVFFLLNDKPIYYKPNRFKTYPIKFDLTQEGDTINYFDEFSLAQGVHIGEFRGYVDNDVIKGEVIHIEQFYYFNEIMVSKIFWVDEYGVERCQYFWDEYNEVPIHARDAYLSTINLWENATKHNTK